jgi:protein gp37
MFGKWVPLRWIEPIFAACRANPQWIPLFLTKFPQRYVELASALSPEWWLGTTVDRQYRVKIAETAFGKIRHLPNTKWLSFEPLLERLQFPDGFFSLFDLVVIGAQTATTQPEGPMPAIAPQLDWVIDIIVQARKAGCAVWCKENLLGVPNPDSPGMILPQEMPRKFLERLARSAA